MPRLVLALYVEGRKKGRKEGQLCTNVVVRAVVATTRVAKMAISQGCHPRQVFYFIYVFIGTCMQNFIKIDHHKNQTFSI